MGSVHMVTGAYGYTGRFISTELLQRGHEVRTLTGSANRENPFGDRIRAFPLDFGDEGGLVAALSGVDVLYNTYWVRFSKAGFSQERAVENTRRLFDAAGRAGVRRVVHISITNPSEDSPYEYFRGKARLERSLRDSGLSHAILRPAVIFGPEDILINNIVWMLRHLPVFGVFGDGSYRLRPIHVDDFARLAVTQGASTDDATLDAVGPETFTYRELVEVLAQAVGVRRRIVSLPASLALGCTRLLGLFLRDIILTGEEVGALMDDLLTTDAAATGQTRLSDWARQESSRLGARYANELARRRNRTAAYADL